MEVSLLATISVSRRLKRLFILFLILTIMIYAFGCVDVYAGKRPSSYPNTKWVSSNPKIYFQVFPIENYNDNIGELDINNNKIIIKMFFDYDVGVGIYDNNILEEANDSSEALLITGQCKFSKTKLIVTIDKVSDRISLDPSIKEIIFIREDLPLETTPNYAPGMSTT